MKQTAVEWLVNELEKYELYSKISYRCLGEIEIALEMEKEQMINAIDYCRDKYIDSENYYNQEFNK